MYLGNYSMDKEVALLTSRRRPPPYLKEIEKTLRSIRDEKKRETLYAQLTEDENPVINRLNLVLLLQKKNPKDIADELEKHHAGLPSKYKQWLHNYGMAAIFLMCRDYKQRKRYFGFDTFIQLSSGIPRFFIQLCFYSFDYARQADGFTFGTESTLSVSSQDRAAYQLSHNKVDEIDTYPPVGHKLKRLALVLGRVFEQLHKRPNIGEPETNHFYTDYDSLSPSAREAIDSGVMWAVFQPKPLTKIKSSGQHRAVEYHLNHVYAPYFQISPRKKRRLDIKSIDFDVLVDGEQDSVAKIAQKLIGHGKLGQLADLLQWEDMQPSQLNLWGSYEGQ